MRTRLTSSLALAQIWLSGSLVLWLLALWLGSLTLAVGRSDSAMCNV